MLASDSSRREIASSMIALSSAANAALDAVRGWAWTGCRFFLARKMELGDGGVRLWAMCHLQIAALRSFVDIPSSPGMVSRASRIPRSTGVRPIASTPRAPREACGNLGVLPACRLASLSACDCYPAICPRSASAPLIETIFSPGATPLTVRSTCCAQRPRAAAFLARWDTHRCWSWTKKRPKPLDHHQDNSGDHGNESAVLPLNYPPPDGRRSSVRIDVSEARELKTLKTENARLKMLLSLP